MRWLWDRSLCRAAHKSLPDLDTVVDSSMRCFFFYSPSPSSSPPSSNSRKIPSRLVRAVTLLAIAAAAVCGFLIARYVASLRSYTTQGGSLTLRPLRYSGSATPHNFSSRSSHSAAAAASLPLQPSSPSAVTLGSVVPSLLQCTPVHPHTRASASATASSAAQENAKKGDRRWLRGWGRGQRAAPANAAGAEGAFSSSLCTQTELKQGPSSLDSEAANADSIPPEDALLLGSVLAAKAATEARSAAVASGRIAFLFLTPGPLPFAPLWESFFKDHEDKVSIYVHSSPGSVGCPLCTTDLFRLNPVSTSKWELGTMSALDAVRRLLATALSDPANFRFVLLSHLCVPVHSYPFIRGYLFESRQAFVESEAVGVDPRLGRVLHYNPHMAPEVPPNQFRRGSMWWAMGRFHAYLVLEDAAVYAKFSHFCRYDKWHGFCIPERYYIPTLLQLQAPGRTANRSVTYDEWVWQAGSRGSSPSTPALGSLTFSSPQLTTAFLCSLQAATHFHPRSNHSKVARCQVMGKPRSCFLFLRRVDPFALPCVLTFLSTECPTR